MKKIKQWERVFLNSKKKPVRVGNFWNNNYIEYKSSGERIKEYLNKIQPYFWDMITSFQKSNTWKIKLTIPIDFIFPKDVEKELVMHSYSDNTELCFMIMQRKLLIKISTKIFKYSSIH